MSSSLNVILMQAYEQLSFEATWVFVPATSGDFMIYPDHMPILSVIASQECMKIQLVDGTLKELCLDNALVFKDSFNNVFIYD